MNFSSIKEYFYKLNSRCYILILIPLASFIFIYFYTQSKDSFLIIQNELLVQIIVYGLCAIAVVNLTTVHWLAWRRMKIYKTEIGLGHKLDRYYEVILLKYGAGCTSSLLMAIGAVLTQNELFGYFFMIILIWMALQWPTSKKACKALALKGDEYKMVFYKQENL
jgi:hypothetical protein